MPLRYDSEVAEHHAVRQAAGLFDLSHMGEIEVVGPSAGAALDYSLVNRPSAIPVGRAKYSLLCAEDGGIIDDLIVYRLGEQRFLIVANAANTAIVIQELTGRCLSFDAVVRDTSADLALLAVQGPASSAVVQQLADVDVSPLRYYGISQARLAGSPVWLARTGYTGEDGFEIYCAPADAEAVWADLEIAGSSHGLRVAGLACRNTLRLEAGMALYGNELTRDVTPFDVGLGRIVELHKTDGFVGERALREARANGASSTLVGLRPAGRRSPRAGYAIHRQSTAEVIGQVTSGAPSPTLGYPIALARLTTDAAEEGTVVDVDVRGVREPSVVVSFPFYKRDRRSSN